MSLSVTDLFFMLGLVLAGPVVAGEKKDREIPIDNGDLFLVSHCEDRRPGHNYFSCHFTLENLGEQDIQEVQVRIETISDSDCPPLQEDLIFQYVRKSHGPKDPMIQAYFRVCPADLDKMVAKTSDLRYEFPED